MRSVLAGLAGKRLLCLVRRHHSLRCPCRLSCGIDGMGGFNLPNQLILSYLTITLDLDNHILATSSEIVLYKVRGLSILDQSKEEHALGHT